MEQTRYEKRAREMAGEIPVPSKAPWRESYEDRIKRLQERDKQLESKIIEKELEVEVKGEEINPGEGKKTLINDEQPVRDQFTTPKRIRGRAKKGMAKRSIEGREIDRAKMVKLMSRGYSKTEIADELEVSTLTVQNDWKAVLRELREEREGLTQEIIEQKLLEYREVKRESWEAWERSKSSHIINKTKNVVTGAGISGKMTSEDTTTTETRVGDNSYLIMVLECLKAEREILGLDPEKKMRLTGEMINWEILAQGVPQNGPIPDLIEEEIRKGVDNDKYIMDNVRDPTIIYIPKEKEKVEGEEREENNLKDCARFEKISSQSNLPITLQGLEDLENNNNLAEGEIV